MHSYCRIFYKKSKITIFILIDLCCDIYLLLRKEALTAPSQLTPEHAEDIPTTHLDCLLS